MCQAGGPAGHLAPVLGPEGCTFVHVLHCLSADGPRADGPARISPARSKWALGETSHFMLTLKPEN